jgi:hypothetical protein
MVRLVILDDAGRSLTPKEVATAADLHSLAEQARKVIRECEQLADTLRREHNKSAPRQAPYSS